LLTNRFTAFFALAFRFFEPFFSNRLRSMKLHCYYVYILSNSHHTVFYTGVTNDLKVRCNQHKNKLNKGFTAKYKIDQLMYFESFDQVDLAINREKQI